MSLFWFISVTSDLPVSTLDGALNPIKSKHAVAKTRIRVQIVFNNNADVAFQLISIKIDDGNEVDDWCEATIDPVACTGVAEWSRPPAMSQNL